MDIIYNNYSYYFNNVLSYFRVFKQKSIQYLYIKFLLYQKNCNLQRLNNFTNTTRMIPNQPITKRISNHFSNMVLEPSHIIDNIYLGNAYNASNVNTIRKYNIECVINVTFEIPNYFENGGIEYFNIEILDNDDHNFTKYQFDNVLNFLNRYQHKNILIHCYMGSSRSATIVVLYLIKKYKYTLEDAIDYLRTKREIVNINNNFIHNLEDYYNIYESIDEVSDQSQLQIDLQLDKK